MARRERMAQSFTSASRRTAEDSAHLSADEKVTMVLAMMDGLRIQTLLDPSRDTSRLLEVFMKTVIRRAQVD